MAQAVADAGSHGLTPADLRGDPGRRRKERTVRIVLLAAATFSIVISALIVLSLVFEAIRYLTLIDLSTLWSQGWFPRRGQFDIKTVFVGSLLVTAIAMAFAAPLGLGAAIFLAEYARPGLRRLLKPILEILAGIPSVVLGFFALTWIAPNVIQRFFEGSAQFNLASAGLGVGILITPLVASISEDAMRAVPYSLREASFGMGARKLTTTLRVVVPAAVSGIVAAFIVAISRAIGETLIVAIAAGASGGSLFTLSALDAGQTMTAAMAALAIGSDQVRGQTGAFESLYFLGLLLFLITMTLNVAADRFVRRVRQKY